MFDSVADLLSGMSASHPVVLVLDDVHWADKPLGYQVRIELERIDS